MNLSSPFSSEKSLRIAQLLLDRVEAAQRAEFVNQASEATMRTALHVAASVGNEPMVRLLADQHGANKEAGDKEVSTGILKQKASI